MEIANNFLSPLALINGQFANNKSSPSYNFGSKDYFFGMQALPKK
jgi:hypothetical protein